MVGAALAGPWPAMALAMDTDDGSEFAPTALTMRPPTLPKPLLKHRSVPLTFTISIRSYPRWSFGELQLISRAGGLT
jgi:hypothetical protein